MKGVTLIEEINNMIRLGRLEDLKARLAAHRASKQTAQGPTIEGSEDKVTINGQPYHIQDLVRSNPRQVIDTVFSKFPADKRPVVLMGNRGVPWILVASYNPNKQNYTPAIVRLEAWKNRPHPFISQQYFETKMKGMLPKRGGTNEAWRDYTGEGQSAYNKAIHLMRFLKDTLKTIKDDGFNDSVLFGGGTVRGGKVPPKGVQVNAQGQEVDPKTGQPKAAPLSVSEAGLHRHKEWPEDEEEKTRVTEGPLHPSGANIHNVALDRVLQDSPKYEKYVDPETGEFIPDDSPEFKQFKQKVSQIERAQQFHQDTVARESTLESLSPEIVLMYSNLTIPNEPWWKQLGVDVGFAKRGMRADEASSDIGKKAVGIWRGKRIEGDSIYSHSDVGDVIIQNSGIRYLVFAPNLDRPREYHTNKALDDIVRLYFEKRIPKPDNYNPYITGVKNWKELMAIKDRVEEVKKLRAEDPKKLEGLNDAQWREWVDNTGAGKRAAYEKLRIALFEASINKLPGYDRYSTLRGLREMNERQKDKKKRVRFNQTDDDFLESFDTELNVRREAFNNSLRQDVAKRYFAPYLLDFSPLDEPDTNKETDPTRLAKLEEQSLDEQSYSSMLKTPAGQKWKSIRDQLEIYDMMKAEAESDENIELNEEEELVETTKPKKRKKQEFTLTPYQTERQDWLKTLSKIASSDAKVEKAKFKSKLSGRPVFVGGVISKDGKNHETLLITPSVDKKKLDVKVQGSTPIPADVQKKYLYAKSAKMPVEHIQSSEAQQQQHLNEEKALTDNRVKRFIERKIGKEPGLLQEDSLGHKLHRDWEDKIQTIWEDTRNSLPERAKIIQRVYPEYTIKRHIKKPEEFTPKEIKVGKKRLAERGKETDVAEQLKEIFTYPKFTSEYSDEYKNWENKVVNIYNEAKKRNPELASDIESRYQQMLKLNPSGIHPLDTVFPKARKEIQINRKKFLIETQLDGAKSYAEHAAKMALKDLEGKEELLPIEERTPKEAKDKLVAKETAKAFNDRLQAIESKFSIKINPKTGAFTDVEATAVSPVTAKPKEAAPSPTPSSISDRIRRIRGESSPPSSPAKEVEQSPTPPAPSALRQRIDAAKQKREAPALTAPDISNVPTADSIRQALESYRNRGAE